MKLGRDALKGGILRVGNGLSCSFFLLLIRLKVVMAMCPIVKSRGDEIFL